MKDREVEKLIKSEEKRQASVINLIASENFVSSDVLRALGSVFTNKYAEGYSGKRYYGGNEVIDEVENLAKSRALKLFNLSPKKWSVNVQPYSGSPANMAVYYALLEPGDKIMGLSLPFGGHLTHGWKVNFSARFYKSVQYTINEDGFIDYREVRKLAKKEKPQLIVSGATAYGRFFDFKKFATIAKEVGAYCLADIAHTAGLIAARIYPSPFPYADVVTATTHKTLRGPRSAMIFANRESRIAKKKKVDIVQVVDRAVFPSLQGGPHENNIAAIAVCLKEAMGHNFKKYAQQVVRNAKVLAQELQKKGWRIVSGGTDSHLFLLDTFSRGISGKTAQNLLEAEGIIVNKNTIPFDTRSPFDPSGIRIGTPALTTRGMKEKEMKKIAFWIDEVISNSKPKIRVKNEVRKLCQKFPIT
mgnify:CR=1 FL=1